ncbi:MAG: hypothetical protein J5525_11405 [Lachnospiraceae bacterium]|nr:hypothetical protein [Lachnospiraceae bacterium]
MNDDREFIDLDSTQNWSQLDVKRELDNLEVDPETGKKYDFARGFTEDAKAEEEKVLLDGLTSGLNYIPEEFLLSADEKHEADLDKVPEEEKPDVSWAYRTEEEKVDDDEPFIPIVELKKTEEEKFAELKAKREAEIEEKRARNLEAQKEELARRNASDEAIKANIAERKKVREAVAAANEQKIREKAEAKKAAMKQAEIDMYNNKDDMFSTQMFDVDEINAPVMTKEERIAAANKNRKSDDMDIPEVTYEMDEYERAKIEEADREARESRELSSGDTGVIYLNEDGEEQQTAGAVAAAAVAAGAKKKKKKADSAADEYAAWADSNDDEADVKSSRRKRRRKAEEEMIDEDDEVFYGGFIDKVTAFFKKMSGLDYLVMGTGILVVLVAIITGVVYSSSKATQTKVAEFAYLGEKMQTIGVTGSSKLVAVADAKKMLAEIEVEPEVEEEDKLPEYQEKEEDTTISVTMTLTSVKKDLKIKFINAKSKKLVGNHEFKVEIVDARNKKFTAVDDDKDGIIYLNNMEPGKTSVSMMDIDDKGLTYSRETVTVTVKENIDYKKIDVSDEVKKESEINAKKEDTAAGLATEGSLADTVEWVESTKTALTDGYSTVTKSSILDPAKITPTPTNKSAKAIGITPMVTDDRQYASKRIFPAPYMLQRASADGTNTENQNSENPTETTPTPEGETPTPTEEPKETPSPTVDVEATKSAEASASAAAQETANASASAAAATNAAATNAAATNAAASSAAAAPTLTAAANASASATAKVTVSPSPGINPKEDKTTPLKDKQGNQIYIKDSEGKYVEAKYADYYTAKEFFKKYEPAADDTTAYKYTGWQVINNETYFFDKNGNKVTGEQVIQGAKYNFDSTGALMKGSGTLGIDVSKWNGNINWTAVKNSGVSFVIIRCGYRGSSTGVMVEDPKFKTNIKGATDAGLKVGIYFFSQAISDVEAVEEASMTIGLIKSYKISYPVFLDVEDSGGRGDRIDSNTRTAVIKAFCETIKNSGYTAGVYANKSWLSGKMNVGSLSAYKIWLAQYNTQPTYSGKYDLWQYSSKGSVGGISGNTDMNLSYLGY